MTQVFPKTDLARLLGVPNPSLRATALASALKYATEADLAACGVSSTSLEALAEEGSLHRFSLQRRMTETSVPVYAATRTGAAEVAIALSVDRDTVPFVTASQAKRSTMFLDHSLARTRFALLLARALAMRPGPASLSSWESSPERLAAAVHLIRAPGELERQPLVADGLATVATARGPEGLLVEIDRATERPSYLARKASGYLHLWREGLHRQYFGVSAIRILIVAPDLKRTERLVQACREATGGRGGGLFWFAAEDELVERGMLAPVWTTLSKDRLPLWR